MEYMPFVWPYFSNKFCELYKQYFNEKVDVQTLLGPVRGFRQSSPYGYEYINFLGIPYGKPPINELRFCDPEPAEPWTTPPNIPNSEPMQKHIVFKSPHGTEDCLHLNVYTKTTAPDALAPVMVFLYGGGYVNGSKTKVLYSPEYLLQKDVVLVVINYRLGAFGFLSVEDPKYRIPGNAALKDQTLALKWVRDNIRCFGGDPTNVTLFGESAGGVSVHYHMISEMSRGLFHKAIAMSGNALSVFAQVMIENVPERLARCMGWDGQGGMDKMIEFLRSAPAEKIIKAQEAVITKEERYKFMLFAFAPIIEPYESAQCFIPKSPILMSREAWSRTMPFMIGGCVDEGFIFRRLTMRNLHFLDKLNKSFENIVPIALEADKSTDRCKRLGIAIKQKYFGDHNLSADTVLNYFKMLGDIWFWHGIHNTINSRLSFPQSGETYLYRFDFNSKIHSHSKYFVAGKDVDGACHGDELSYIFKFSIACPVSNDSREYQTVIKMVNLLTSFAKTGKPIMDTMDQSPKWLPVEYGKPYKCLNISDHLDYFELPETERMLFLDRLYEGIDLY